MELEELLGTIANGEDSKHQFKSNIKHPETLSKEIVAFSNSDDGGTIIIGVTDQGEISGLNTDDVIRINQHISNAISQHVKPINHRITTQTFSLKLGKLIIVFVPIGLNKPYMDKNHQIYKKIGSDTIKVSSREEIIRLYQRAGLAKTDASLVDDATLADIDRTFFSKFFIKEYGERIEDQNISLKQLLENMKLASDGTLNYCGVLLFALKPQNLLPVFNLKAVAFFGNDITDTNYIDSKDFNGKLIDIYQQAVSFVLSNIHHVQKDQGFNSVGIPEIPRNVIQELITNALIHRDYFIRSPIKLFVFKDRIEIISPGHLPNKLTVANIKMGVSVARNPLLYSFAPKILYRGLGSGILRSLKEYPNIEFEDHREENLFKAIIKRKPIQKNS